MIKEVKTVTSGGGFNQLKVFCFPLNEGLVKSSKARFRISFLPRLLILLPGAVFVALERKTRMGPLFAGLDAAHYEITSYQRTINVHNP